MARNVPPPPPRPANLSIVAKQTAIPKLMKRIGELSDFDPKSVRDRRDPRITTLGQAIDRTLADVFGHNTIEYDRYQYIEKLDTAGHFIGQETPIHEVIESLEKNKTEAIAVLDGIISGFKEDTEEFAPSVEGAPGAGSAALGSRKVFVVHGHDDGARETVARFLEKIELKAIILQEQPSQGLTIIEKFESHASQVGFAVVVLTPDDLGGPTAAMAQSSRARQNVIFELGYFAGKLGRGRVCVLRKGEIEIPSDLYGVIYTDMDVGEGWKLKLAKELKAAGLKFDGDKVF
jgi:predicted nucleotide-binding protein